MYDQKNYINLLNKLANEYQDLNGKINRLNDFINRIDFEDVIEDVKEQNLMTDQYVAMCHYRVNLKARIRCISKRCANICTQEQECGIIRLSDGDFSVIVPKRSMDDIDINKVCDELAKAWKAYCEENHDLDTHHCGQDAHDPCGESGTEGNPIPLPSPVDDGSAAVEDVPVSIKELIGMQVVGVGDNRCATCPMNNYGEPCKKVELVGGYYLCLAPLPNSIVTE